MNTANLSPISAEAVAAKLESIANFEQPELFEELAEQPRLAEALWFLQFVSQPENYAGGLGRFCADFINECAVELGSSEMLAWFRLGAKKRTFQKAGRIYHELPIDQQSALLPRSLRLLFGAPAEEESASAIDDLLYDPTATQESAVRFGEALRRQAELEARQSPKDKATHTAERRAAENEAVAMRLTDEAEALAKFTRERLLGICREEAQDSLGNYFKRLCEEADVTFRRRGCRDWRDSSPRAPWYFVNVADALLAFIDRRKAKLASRIAETEITKLVFEWMSVSHGTGRGVLIEGNSRFGKTEAIKLWCDMNPGIARLVNTPATNAIGDLLREVARALGIDSAPGRRGHDLRERIEYVLRFSKLLLCFDESNFLLPGSYSKNTAPARLNWVRRSIIDRKTPAVFVYTPQTNGPAKKRFVKATGYTMEQFDERILMTVNLPNELCEADLIAVARIHFRDLSEIHLKYVVSKALATERNYVSDIEKIATLANYKAKAAGRAVPLLADINAAIANVLPVAKTLTAGPIAMPGALIARSPGTRSSRASATPSSASAAAPLRRPCMRAAAPLQSSRITFLDSAQEADNEPEALAKT